MNKAFGLICIVGVVFLIGGCATLKDMPLDADRTAQTFFNDLERSDSQAAYGLLAKGISQRISYDQFDGFMQTLRGQWGRMETNETALLPFHRRVGEANFIPLDAKPTQIKRYVYDVKFTNAEMNFDLTLAPEGGSYKIIWFSIWGSSIYMTKQVQEKIEQLFSAADSTQ